jgi:hypothetical protein
MSIDNAAALRYWTASKTLLNPATPAEEADDAGIALLQIAQYSRNERLSLRAYDSLATATENGLLDFEIDFAMEA